MSFKTIYAFLIMYSISIFMILFFYVLRNPPIKLYINNESDYKQGTMERFENKTKGCNKSFGRRQSIGLNQSIGWRQFCEENLTKNLSFAKYADKVGVKEIIREHSLNISIPKTYGTVKDVEHITLEMIKSLPSKYVFKANHGAYMTIIVRDNLFTCYGYCEKSFYSGSSKKLQQMFLKTNCNKWLMVDFGKKNNERHYSKIERKCFFEEMIPQNDDYRIHCFHGKPAIIEVFADRFKTRSQTFYTTSWCKINMNKTIPEPTIDVEKPVILKEMLEVAKKLSRGFAFVRVDLYINQQAIVFSELSFSPNACHTTYSPLIADKFYGLLAAGGNQDPENIICLLSK